MNKVSVVSDFDDAMTFPQANHFFFSALFYEFATVNMERYTFSQQPSWL